MTIMSTETNNPQERRKYIRVCSGNMLTHEKYTLKEHDELRAVEGILKDYSAGGVLFESKDKYNVGDLLKLEISIPGWEQFKNEFYKEGRPTLSEPVVVLAVVVRLENVIVDQLYDVGVCFVSIDEGHRWALIKQINSEP